jgi:hypothetical protein
MKKDEYVRGAKAAAEVADQYQTTHPYCLYDCILSKLNISSRKLRRNKHKLQTPDEAWLCGYAVALAEVSRIDGRNANIVRAAQVASFTIEEIKKLGVDSYDWRELKRAGVK